MKTQTAEQVTRLGAAFARLVMIVMAVAIVLTVATFISTPLAIPFVVAHWLGAAAILALGVWGPLPTAGSGASGGRQAECLPAGGRRRDL